MRITSFSTSHSQMGSTRTYEDFHKWLGEKPERLGIVSNLYKQYTATSLTEALMNVYSDDMNKPNRFRPSNSFMLEWDIDVNFVKRIPILAVEGDGADGSEVIFHFPERYYEMYDVFVIEETRQQCMVTMTPIRRSDACVECVCRIVDNDYRDRLDVDAIIGTDTRFIINHMPELHETGFSKYQSNVEKHRTMIGTTRCDIDVSAKYMAMEDQFINIATKDKDLTLKLTGAEKVCLDSYMEARNNKLLFSRGNFDANGKVTIHDNIGRPVVATEGIIPQIERFASKFVFNKFNVRIFEKAMNEMSTKCENPTGNTWVFALNSRFWQIVQRTMSNWIRDWKTTGCFVWSQGAKDYVDLGATYQSYEFAGNKIVFRLDRSLDLEFPKKAYGILVDLTSDSNGTPGMMFFTFKGGDIIHNIIKGVGGKTGLESGEVSSPVAGSKIVNWGYHAVGVMNPYRSAIFEEI